MPRQISSLVENNFTKGLITEATALNFPENAATSASNCIFTRIGDVTRRLGFNQEVNGVSKGLSSNLVGAQTTYVWNNPGGQSNVRILVQQIGVYLYFYNLSASTTLSPLSTQLITIIDFSSNVALGATFDNTLECQFASGNGYLFVYQETCQPFYCTYISGTIATNSISIQIRDFVGVIDGLDANTRPATLTSPHSYNLQNQGWTAGNAWAASSSASQTIAIGANSWNIGTITGPAVGQIVQVRGRVAGAPWYVNATGTITSYSSGTLTLNIYNIDTNAPGGTFSNWGFNPISTGYINTWNTAEGNYPSNADVWWYFKDSTGAFNPATTQPNVTLATGNAPQGHYILDAFNQNRITVSGVSGINIVSTVKRPTTGTWFQGRVWYCGVNDSAAATSTTNFQAWAGNIYFSNVVTSPLDFGLCYQTNDPTSENLHDILPTDGGIISIPEAGTIHKLFPTQNGLLVFANNGVWFITGSSGIGFTASDYTITKISGVRSISSKSFVDVQGLPYFWNEEGIYQVIAAQNGQLAVEPLTVGTILSFYNSIPIQSKIYARGDYNPITYTIQWSYRSTPEVGSSNRYLMDTILNYNTFTKAFYPYNFTSSDLGLTVPYISGVFYVSYPVVNPTTPLPTFKYPIQFTTVTSTFTFAEENDSTYTDWNYVAPTNFTSSFVTGYKFDTRKWATFYQGQAWRKFQSLYIYTFSRNSGYAAYYIQGLWDFAKNSDSNRWSVKQFVELLDSNSNNLYRRHKIRGRGNVLQLQVTSVDGQPFDLIGWSIVDSLNSGV